jgi:hypothetical protein
MRKTVEPPPSSQCDRCGGQLKLKRVDAAHVVLGLSSTIYVCGTCGTERAFVKQRRAFWSAIGHLPHRSAKVVSALDW